MKRMIKKNKGCDFCNRWKKEMDICREVKKNLRVIGDREVECNIYWGRRFRNYGYIRIERIYWKIRRFKG